MTQDFNPAEQDEKASFENFEKEKAENILTTFFSDCNEEERKIIDEFSQIQGIRANDAIWVFVKVFFRINRANNTLQQRISEALLSVSLNQQRKRAWIYDFFVPVVFVCLGIFFLCLISFIGGAAVAGKGWGHSPVEALLKAPAGWIIPLALIPVCGLALFRGLTEQGKSRLINLTIALIIAVSVLFVLIHIL
ncbi:MAG: hypothetical protein IJ859_11830 [Synergistaceae bacterium]|nr:hypothetical protein [Synergistaceae bacterium]